MHFYYPAAVQKFAIVGNAFICRRIICFYRLIYYFNSAQRTLQHDLAFKIITPGAAWNCRNYANRICPEAALTVQNARTGFKIDKIIR